MPEGETDPVVIYEINLGALEFIVQEFKVQEFSVYCLNVSITLLSVHDKLGI